MPDRLGFSLDDNSGREKRAMTPDVRPYIDDSIKWLKLKPNIQPWSRTRIVITPHAFQNVQMTKITSVESDTVTVVVMGVSGCGKSTVAEYLATELGATFKDGDDLHPPENIQRMSNGIPLTDADREPWLHLVKDFAAAVNSDGQHCVIACSALRKSYRDILRQAGTVWFVHLTGSRELIASRMHLRTGHFMPEALLDSQIATLETPQKEACVVSVDISNTASEVAQLAAKALRSETDFFTI